MTPILEHDEVCAPAGAYLLYRVTQILDGRRVVLSIDEFRFYLKNPQFAAVGFPRPRGDGPKNP